MVMSLLNFYIPYCIENRSILNFTEKPVNEYAIDPLRVVGKQN